MKVTRPAQCHFFTELVAMRMAVKAYRAACLESLPPAHDPFVMDEVPWSSPAIWAQEFIRQMHLQVEAAAIERRVPWDTGSVLKEFGWELPVLQNAPELRLLVNSLRLPDNPADNQSGEVSDNA
jgi:hypothetical protein